MKIDKVIPDLEGVIKYSITVLEGSKSSFILMRFEDFIFMDGEK